MRRLFPIAYVPLAVASYTILVAEGSPFNSLVRDIATNSLLACTILGAIWYSLVFKEVRGGDPNAPRSPDLMMFVCMAWSLFAAGLLLIVAMLVRY
ncbi:MAG: hypothetical protein R3C31_04380 [Hyphomonadaceae bacterium]